MDADELLDLVNDKDEVIGTVAREVARHDPSKAYRIASVTIFNKKGEALIQKRSRNSSRSGMWENSASGHVAAGEDPQKTAKREVREELGIECEPVYWGKKLVKLETRTKFVWLYYAVVENEVDVKPDNLEVEEVRWIKPQDLVDFSKNNNWDVNGLSHKVVMEVEKILYKA